MEQIYLPWKEERFVEAIVDVNDEIVIGNGVNVRSRKLPVDQYTLTGKCEIHRFLITGSIINQTGNKLNWYEISQYLLANTERPDIAVSYIPFEESVRIFCLDDGEEKRESDD